MASYQEIFEAQDILKAQKAKEEASQTYFVATSRRVGVFEGPEDLEPHEWLRQIAVGYPIKLKRYEHERDPTAYASNATGFWLLGITDIDSYPSRLRLGSCKSCLQPSYPISGF